MEAVPRLDAAGRFSEAADRWFQASLLLLLLNGLLGLWAAGQVDALAGCALLAAFAFRACGPLRRGGVKLPPRLVSALTAAVIAFYPLDLYLLQEGGFTASTVRLMLLFTALKIAAAETGRDYFYLGVLAFLHLLTAASFVAGPGYFVLLAVFAASAVFCYGSFALRRAGGRDARPALSPGMAQAPRIVGRLGSFALLFAGAALALGMALFLVLPRAPAEARLAPFGRNYPAGFSDGVDLGLTGALQHDFTPVMRVQSLDGAPVGAQRWRGVALSLFDGVRWSRAAQRSTALPASREGYRPNWRARRRGADFRRLRYSVVVEPLPVRAVFVAGVPEAVRGAFPRLWRTPSESLLVEGLAPAQELRYQVSGWIADPDSIPPRRAVELFSRRFAENNLRLPRNLDPRILGYALEIAGGRSDPLERARAVEEHLKTAFGYTLEFPREQAADPLANFLFERREGHCEYFASAMAVMLRTMGIPARLVNGFAGGVYNPLSGARVIRAADAHSWVEAYIPRYGWLEFDPTPAAPAGFAGPWLTQAWMIWDALESLWGEWVIDYDAERRREIARGVTLRSQSAALAAILSLEALVRQARRLWERLTGGSGAAQPAFDALAAPPLLRLLGAVALAAFLVAAALFWRRRFRWRDAVRRRREHPGAALYRRAVRALARRGIRKPASLTPQELAAQVADPALRRAVQELTDAYLAARFGGDGKALKRLRGLVRAVESRRRAPA